MGVVHMIENETGNISNNSYYQKVDEATAVKFLRELANYVKTRGYSTWEKKTQSKPFLRNNRYLFVSMKLINKLLKDIGTTSQKMANFLRDWEDGPYIAHTSVAFYVKGRRKTLSMWVFDFERLMKFADSDDSEPKKE
jgi:hypothetical protein